MQHPYQKRRRKLQAAVKKSGADAFLVTNIKNVSYLTGFSGSAGYLIVTPKTEILLSDTRYSTQIQDECPGIEVAIRDAQTTMFELTQSICRSSKLKTLSYESDSLKKSEFDQLGSTLSGIELVPTRGWIEGLRAIKDKSEIIAIRKSIDVNQRAFHVIQAQLTPANTELQIAHNLEHQMRAFGAKGCAFEPIVGVGARSALPHGQPTATPVNESPFLLIDWGAEVDNYLSDLTRMIFTGKIPAKMRKIYNVVLRAQLAAIKKIRPGQSFKAIDQAARKVIEIAGFGPHFGHGTGHSFGLEIHEQPYMSPIHEGLIEAGMVITIEPGIYLPDFGGVRIEDDVLVTPDGHEVLSNLPKQIDECTVDLG
ncbi:MAG: Xaa-Pro aminopeptidase, partial [Mariniblastus sp.]